MEKRRQTSPIDVADRRNVSRYAELLESEEGKRREGLKANREEEGGSGERQWREKGKRKEDEELCQKAK